MIFSDNLSNMEVIYATSEAKSGIIYTKSFRIKAYLPKQIQPIAKPQSIDTIRRTLGDTFFGWKTVR